METVKKPKVKLVYEGRDITQDIFAHLISVEYADNSGNNSDEVSFSVHDAFGMWRGAWFPFKGDKLSLEIGYDNNLVKCGSFTVDEIELVGPPDVVNIRALAAGINSPLRTKNSKAYEGQSLKQIADQVAKKYGYEVVQDKSGGKRLESIRIERVTQNRETDLEFLRRVSADFGITFSIRDSKLIFISTANVENADGVTTIDRTDLISYNIKEKATKIYKRATVTHHNKKKNKITKAEVEAKSQTAEANSLRINSEHASSEDTLVIYAKVDNVQQAEEMARAALHLANSKHQEGNVTVPGNPLLVAGNNFDLTGMGSLSGKYNIIKSSHRIDRGGYTTDLEVKRIGSISNLGEKATAGEVLFDTDSSVIRPAGITEIERVIAWMRKSPDIIIEIGGHTDSEASAEYNKALSERRSKAVLDYMVAQGILATRLVARGYGEIKPVASNSTADGRQKNRRTEFVVVGNIS